MTALAHIAVCGKAAALQRNLQTVTKACQCANADPAANRAGALSQTVNPVCHWPERLYTAAGQ
jgi:hypothetical protein